MVTSEVQQATPWDYGDITHPHEYLERPRVSISARAPAGRHDGLTLVGLNCQNATQMSSENSSPRNTSANTWQLTEWWLV